MGLLEMTLLLSLANALAEEPEEAKSEPEETDCESIEEAKRKLEKMFGISEELDRNEERVEEANRKLTDWNKIMDSIEESMNESEAKEGHFSFDTKDGKSIYISVEQKDKEDAD